FSFETLTVTSTSPGDGPLGAMLQDIQISTRNSAGSNKTLTVTVSDDGFTSPGLPGQGVTMYSSLASSFVSPGGMGTFHSSLDGMPDGRLRLTGVDSKAEATSVTRGPGSSYTLGNALTIPLGANGTAQLTGTTTVSPAGAGLVLAATGLPFLGLGYWRCRR